MFRSQPIFSSSPPHDFLKESAISPRTYKVSMTKGLPILYRIAGWVVRGALGFYFVRIERFHHERVPLAGPVLFTSNHPNSLTDAFVIGSSVARKVNFVATVRLFRFGPLGWLLTRCGVIPINRVKDDPRGMRTVAGTFEACYRVLEHGEAVGIFPEGITHDDPQLKTVKSGAARMSLELEHRHAGKLGLQIVPVGLTFSEKERYRSYALVNFGAPIRPVDFLPAYRLNRHAAIHALNEEIERRIRALILHLPHLERARVVAAVKRLYLERLWAGNSVIHEPVTPHTGELLLTQAIATAVDATFEGHPDRAAEFVHKLDRYERLLRQLHLSDEVAGALPKPAATGNAQFRLGLAGAAGRAGGSVRLDAPLPARHRVRMGGKQSHQDPGLTRPMFPPQPSLGG